MADKKHEELSKHAALWCWQSLIPLALVIDGILHGVKPRWFALDWPSVALILTGALVWLIPATDLGRVFKSVEFGSLKLRFQAQELHSDVEKAKQAGISVEGRRNADAAAKRGRTDMAADCEPSLANAVGRKTDAQTHSSYSGIDAAQFLAADKKMMLIKLGIDIDRDVKRLSAKLGIHEQGQPYLPVLVIWELRRNGAITSEMANALTQFQKVRNEIVHASRDVPDAVIASAIDSGLSMRQLLNAALKFDESS